MTLSRKLIGVSQLTLSLYYQEKLGPSRKEPFISVLCELRKQFEFFTAKNESSHIKK